MKTILFCCLAALLGDTFLQAKTFNVTDYGAKGDDQTDNTEAFSKCIKDILEAGGGKMYLPDGIYRGRIVIPGTKQWLTIQIEGESEPTHVFGTIGNFPYSNTGTILKCLDTSGPAVITALNEPDRLYNSFSGVNVCLKNLEIRTTDNPGISGVDLLHAAQCKVENVFINTGVYNVQASKPTHETSGLITPAHCNAAWTVLRKVTVTGYFNGLMIHEHTDGDYLNFGSTVHALRFMKAQHASRFARVCVQRCTHAVTVSGLHGFQIDQLDLEWVGPRQSDAHNEWQKVVSDVNDPNNLGTGEITWWGVRGNVGATDEFTVNGAKGIRVRRIGNK